MTTPVNTNLGCRTVVVPDHSPFGSLDSATGGLGRVTVAGWAVDPDSSGPLNVNLVMDGAVTTVVANGNRPDVGAAYPSAGSGHGFTATLTDRRRIAPGVRLRPQHRGRLQLGARLSHRRRARREPDRLDGQRHRCERRACRSAGGRSIPTPRPRSRSTSTSTVSGSPPPPRSPDPTSAVRTRATGRTTATRRWLPPAPGTRTACAYGINVASGTTNSLLGCRTVVVPDTSPFGSLDAVTGAPGGVRVKGWAIDPDTTSPIQVHVFVDGVSSTILADKSRPDVGAAFPSAGSNHGYAATIGTAPGNHSVCAWALNVGGGGNRLLGCRSSPSG